MRRYLLLTLLLSGCLTTQTKTNLKRPDFSEPGCCAVNSTSPVQTKSCCNRTSTEPEWNDNFFSEPF